MNETKRHWWSRFYLAFLGRNFSYNLVWPAAAGNVFWSLLWLAIDYDSRTTAGTEWWPRMALLFLLSAYLAFDWQREQMVAKTVTPQQDTIRYWFFEELHLLAIASVAILTATNASVWWVSRGLGAFFAVTTAGHLFGAWNRHLVSTLGKAGANLLGLVLSLSIATDEPWRPAAVMLAVLATWIAIVVGEHLEWSFLLRDVGESIRKWREQRGQQADEVRKAKEAERAEAAKKANEAEQSQPTQPV